MRISCANAITKVFLIIASDRSGLSTEERFDFLEIPNSGSSGVGDRLLNIAH
ncbi:hypothetical protein I8748_05425 [Nostoc sp. CENA67]|uniref:Uncharacterized protein n=1 Tax=Amazonocrinis nigriterrae CENA67 TaxID=2794033 RepID=A0A8J7L6T5_9NOST|nr:hypothetical protein [Amazonocrinis nigriterrae]MBH8561623.1 hypothetical protein [Amazonocrinis nigriterrae CENA67]